MTVGKFRKAKSCKWRGAVAAAGIISLFRSIPLIWHGLKGGLEDLRTRGPRKLSRAPIGSLDEMVLGGIIALLIVIMIARN